LENLEFWNAIPSHCLDALLGLMRDHPHLSFVSHSVRSKGSLPLRECGFLNPRMAEKIPFELRQLRTYLDSR